MTAALDAPLAAEVSGVTTVRPAGGGTPPAVQRRQQGHLRHTWPVHGRQSGQLIGGWLLLTVVWIGLGKLLTGPFADSWIVHTDQRLANWMVAHRTPTGDQLTIWGSLLAETTTKVTVTAVAALVFLLLWRRWLEPVVLVLSLLIEATAFIVVTSVVGRHRPDVPRLDGSPVGSSFPSGHTAAAAAYIAFAAIVFWHTKKRWARVLVVIVTALVPFVVATARIYRGMHFLSDTVAGVVLGGAAVALTILVLKRSPEGVAITSASTGPASTGPAAGLTPSASAPSPDGSATR
jgi:membrane-associated phospholipid phosphatase